MENKAWFCLCISDKKPDGPCKVFGFYPEREWAELEGGDPSICSSNHVVVYGPGSEEIAIRMDSGSSEGWDLAYAYWLEHLYEIPEVLVDWFKGFAGIPLESEENEVLCSD